DQFAWDTFVPWVAGAAFEAAAKAGHITPTSTPADVKAGLYKFKNETLGGVTPPMTFAKGKPGFLGCWFTMGVDGGKFTLPDGSAAKCLTPAQGQALGKALAAAG